MELIYYNNNLRNIITPQKTSFRGKGIDLIHNWQHNNSTRLEYYKDIANDLAEGAKLYLKKHREIDSSVKNFHANGGLTVFFEIPDSKILKVSLENPLEYRKHNPDFDIPFLTSVENYGKTFIVVQPKADTENIKQKDCIDVIKRIYRGFCELSRDGYKVEQYGLYNGKAYLIDTRCAMPMPNMYTSIVDKICNKLNKCYIFLDEEEAQQERLELFKMKGYFSYHVDETPRQNLSFMEGIKKIYRVLKNNFQYKKNHYCIPYQDYKLQQ